MKRAAIIAKLESFQSVFATGMLSKQQVESALNDGLAKKTLRRVRLEEFAPEQTELIEFAKQFNILKASKGEPGTPRGPRGESYEKLARAQYPALDAALAPADALGDAVFDITLSTGEVVPVAYQPYFRRVKVKAVATPAPAGDAQTTV